MTMVAVEQKSLLLVFLFLSFLFFKIFERVRAWVGESERERAPAGEGQRKREK